MALFKQIFLNKAIDGRETDYAMTECRSFNVKRLKIQRQKQA